MYNENAFSLSIFAIVFMFDASLYLKKLFSKHLLAYAASNPHSRRYSFS
jgi:hypothetical protein